MRIIIDIEGANVTATTVGDHGEPAAPLDTVSDTPPADVLAAAAKIGAINAGPAPAGLDLPASVENRLDAPALDMLALSSTEADAGKAPEAVSALSKEASTGRKRSRSRNRRRRH